MERVLKRDAKAEFLQQANFVDDCTVANFTTQITTVTVHIFLIYAYCNQRQYLKMYLGEPHDMKVRVFATTLIQLITSLLYFLPELSYQLIKSLPDDDIKEILHHTVPNTRKKESRRTGIQVLRWTHPFYGRDF